MNIVKKKCLQCGKEFDCPSTWRRTQWCEDCSSKKQKHRKNGHKISAELSKRARAEGKPCERCGKAGVTYHHIIELSDGGGTGLDNLVFLCQRCHNEIHFPGTLHREIE